MRPAHIVEIVTPKKFVLNGIWFGPSKPKRVIIWVHGMFSSVFSMRHIIDLLTDADTAVLAFNNRGFETVSEIKQLVGKKRGTAHEVFTDCVDDIDGAAHLAQASGAKEIYLAGHSTGCQKITYWASKRKDAKKIKGLIYLGSLSDYAGTPQHRQFPVALRAAKAMVKSGKSAELVPTALWWHYADAQRFLSLYTPDSVEQSIFPYFDRKRHSKVFSSVRLPILALFAGSDEYVDRPNKDITDWFERESRGNLKSIIIPEVGHSFRGGEDKVVSSIASWISGQK